MMISKIKYADGAGDDDEFTNDGRLLEDIEAISKALHLHISPQQRLISHIKTVERYSASFSDSKISQSGKSSRGVHHRNSLFRDRKSPVWDWKKPLKALAHVTQRRFRASFLLHVHSIEGLPPRFNDATLSVYWKRHDHVLQTLPSTVSNGTAKFDEILAHRCNVYAKIGTMHAAKYEPKISLIHVSVIGAPRVNTGEHWVDLTRLLPLTLDELKGDKSNGSWATSFALSGNAKGAVLNVSFRYSLQCDNHSVAGGHLRDDDAVMQRIDNFSCSSSVTSVQSYQPDESGKHDLESSCFKSELSKSMSLLHQKLHELKINAAKNQKTELGFVSEKGRNVSDYDDIMFSVAQQWMQISDKICQKSDAEQAGVGEEQSVEVINVNELFSDDDDKSPRPAKLYSLNRAASVDNLFIPESGKETKGYNNKKSAYKSGKVLEKSQSLDDVSEEVTKDFLNMLVEGDDGADLLSPRERLLRQFEDEAEASGSFFSQTSEFGDSNDSDEFDFSSSASSKKKPSLLQTKQMAKVVEDMETEALMLEWGLSENAFRKSPRCSSDGFGSPIELLPEDSISLESLGEGFGSFLRVKNGGFLQSMKPSLFADAKSSGGLIMQISRPVVLPHLGIDFLDIVRHFASTNVDNLALLINELMPLEDLKGKTLTEVAEESHSMGEQFQNPIDDELGLHFVTFDDLIPLMIDKISDLSIEGLRIQSGMSDEQPPSTVAGEPLHNKPPSPCHGLSLQNFLDFERASEGKNGCDLEDTFARSIPLEYWVKLDSRRINDDDLHTKLSVATKVQLRDPQRDYEPVGAPTVAVVHLERTYIRRMLLPGFTTVERGPSNEDYDERDEVVVVEEAERCPCFKILETHLSGLHVNPEKTKHWSTRTQHQSGTRWLLTHSMTRSKCRANSRQPLSKSKAMVVSHSPVNRKEDMEYLWSLSSASQQMFRNPDVVFVRQV